jgi:hypothetical protein
MKKSQKGYAVMLLTALIVTAFGCGAGYSGGGNNMYHMPPTPAPTKTR